MADSSQTLPPAAASPTITRVLRREFALFVALFFVGFVLMPVAIFWVGQSIFGEYGGVGYGDFFGRISEKIRSGDRVAWFLVLSPYLGWQCLRGMMRGWRRLGSDS